MVNKIINRPINVSTVLVYPSETKRSNVNLDRERPHFTKSYELNSIDEAVRKSTKQSLKELLNKKNREFPCHLGNKDYDNLLMKLVERCKSFFTSEYGRNEDDYLRFVNKTTKDYKLKEEKENICLTRMNYYKAEMESEKKRKRHSAVSSRRNKTVGSSRLKSRLFKSGELTKFKSTLKVKPKQSFKSFKKLKKTVNRKTFDDEGLTDGSGMSESFSEISLARTAPVQKSKPFIFRLSDPLMKFKGITVNDDLPFRFTTLAAFPSNPLTFWFQPRNDIERYYYPDKSVCSVFYKDGSGCVYYKNGQPAITFTYGKLGPMITVYSQSRKRRGTFHGQIPVGVFDLKGNGVVYNDHGHKRLIYDQAEGILYDHPNKIPLRWKWESYDQVMCRRNELKFVQANNLHDLGYEEKKTEVERKIYNKLMSQKSKKKRKSVMSKIKNKLKQTAPQVYPVNSFTKRKWGKLKSKSELPKRISNIDLVKKFMKGPWEMPKLLKFIGKGFLVQPLSTPCEDLINLPVRDPCLCPFNKRYPPCPGQGSPQDQESEQDEKGKGYSEDKQSPKGKHTGDKSQYRGKRRNRPFHKSGREKQSSKAKVVCTLSEIRIIPSTRCSDICKRVSLLKPIVMRLTENVSLVIMDQEHIHIDFLSYPNHHMFSIGVSLQLDMVESIYDAKDPYAKRELLPSIFEVLKNKCELLHDINIIIAKLKQEYNHQVINDRMKKLKYWGQDKLFRKIPFCILMDNKCTCFQCPCGK